jgi:hypothetical protein
VWREEHSSFLIPDWTNRKISQSIEKKRNYIINKKNITSHWTGTSGMLLAVYWSLARKERINLLFYMGQKMGNLKNEF